MNKHICKGCTQESQSHTCCPYQIHTYEECNCDDEKEQAMMELIRPGMNFVSKEMINNTHIELQIEAIDENGVITFSDFDDEGYYCNHKANNKQEFLKTAKSWLNEFYIIPKEKDFSEYEFTNRFAFRYYMTYKNYRNDPDNKEYIEQNKEEFDKGFEKEKQIRINLIKEALQNEIKKQYSEIYFYWCDTFDLPEYKQMLIDKGYIDNENN